MDKGAQLSTLLDTLAGQRVFVRCGQKTDARIAEQIYELALVAQEALNDLLHPGSVGPTSVAEVADALKQVNARTAADRLANLSTYDLAYGSTLRDRVPNQARADAQQVVDLLGIDAVWWSNEVTIAPNALAWNPVTHHTFDGVVAGVGDSHFAVLLQVSED